jgi:DNA-binding NarL/FixJ family response regulator
VLVGGPLLAGVVPAVRQVEGVAVQSLLVVEFPDGLPGPTTGWPERRRTLAWFLLHIGTGAVVVADVLGLIALAGASAARKLIGRDPGFAEKALATIETASRRAAAELDQMLGLLRGARGFLLKRSIPDDFVNAVRTVHSGESLLFPAAIRRLATRHGTPGGRGLAKANLTDRETEVLRLIAQGRSNPEIAASCSSEWGP